MKCTCMAYAYTWVDCCHLHRLCRYEINTGCTDLFFCQCMDTFQNHSDHKSDNFQVNCLCWWSAHKSFGQFIEIKNKTVHFWLSIMFRQWCVFYLHNSCKEEKNNFNFVMKSILLSNSLFTVHAYSYKYCTRWFIDIYKNQSVWQ